jgi:signal transduction histidine kinase
MRLWAIHPLRRLRSTREILDGPSERLVSVVLGFVLVAIAALATVPWAGFAYSRPLYAELNDVLAPTRELVARQQIALAIQGVSLRDYLTSPNVSHATRYHAALADEMRATEELTAVVEQLGSDPQRRFQRVRAEQRQWHELTRRVLAGGQSARDSDVLAAAHEEVLAATLAFAAALTEAGRHRRASLLRAERLQSGAAMALGVLAIIGALAVAWLEHRMRLTAAALRARSVELERTKDSRERLMRGVTHDLRNPLQAIDGHAGLLEDGLRGPLLPPQRESIQRIRQSVRTMLSLIKDLLDLSRSETGEMRVKLSDVDVGTLVRDVVEQLRPAAERSGHSIDFEDAGSPARLRTDAGRVREVVANLVSNAIKYTASGGRIVVRQQPRDHIVDGARTHGFAIDVSDNGSGIPEAQQESIFDEFVRLDQHQDLPGSGLGLAMARRIARALGGDLTLESKPGNGSTFTLWVPRLDASATTSSAQPLAAALR